MWHTRRQADAGADNINLIPAVFKQAEAFDTVGFFFKQVDESQNFFCFQTMDAVDNDGIGILDISAALFVRFGNIHFMGEQLQAESAEGAACDFTFGINTMNLRAQCGQQFGRYQIRFVDDGKVAVAQLMFHHLYIANLFHEVVRIYKTNGSALVIMFQNGAVLRTVQDLSLIHI